MDKSKEFILGLLETRLGWIAYTHDDWIKERDELKAAIKWVKEKE